MGVCKKLLLMPAIERKKSKRKHLKVQLEKANAGKM
jgi:hypothetical protein